MFIYETAQSRSSKTGKGASLRVMMLAGQTDDERAIRLLVREFAPLTFEGALVRLNTDQQPLGNGLWTCSADYGIGEFQSDKNPGEGGTGSGGSNDSNQPAPGDPIGPHVNISIAGRTQHVTQALRSTAAKRTADSREIPDYKGAIGVTKQGIEGCDIIVPELKWSETWTFNPAYLTWAYVGDLEGLIGRTNNATFRSFEAGEVKFLGGEISTDDSDKGKVVFNFHKESNIDVTLTPEFNTIAKDGHQYLEVEYEQKDFPLVGAIGNIPRVVRVHEVGRPGLMTDGSDGTDPRPTNQADFKLIGIGR